MIQWMCTAGHVEDNRSNLIKVGDRYFCPECMKSNPPMTHSTEQDIVDMLTRGHQGSGVNPLTCKHAIDLITRLCAERDAAARERYQLIADLADMKARAMRGEAAARDMRERCARLIQSGAGMADLSDQQELDQQAEYILRLSLIATEGTPHG